MQALRGTIQQVVDDLLDQAEQDTAERGEAAPDRRMDLIEAFAYPFPVTVISDMLGIPREDRDTIRGWTENLLRVDRGRVEEEVRAGLREFIDYVCPHRNLPARSTVLAAVDSQVSIRS